MVRRLLIVLAAAAVSACSESPVQPAAPDEQTTPDRLGELGSDPLYVEVTAMLSDPALLALGPEERDSLSPDDQLLLAAIDLMETSAGGDTG